MSLLFTVVDTLEIGSAEVYPLSIDFTALLAAAENADNPTCTLYDLATETSYAAGIVAGSVSGSGKFLSVALSTLQAGHRYRLVVTCRPNATSNKTVEAAVLIICPF